MEDTALLYGSSELSPSQSSSTEGKRVHTIDGEERRGERRRGLGGNGGGKEEKRKTRRAEDNDNRQ